MHRTLTSAATAAVLALALAGCGGSNDEPHTGKTTSTSKPTPSASTPSTPATTGTPAAAAKTILQVWARPALPYAQWWSQLQPLLSEAAAMAYEHTNPAQIPALRVTGSAKTNPMPPGEADLTAQVAVPTSVGVFQVALSRESTSSPWQLLRLGFPPGQH